MLKFSFEISRPGSTGVPTATTTSSTATSSNSSQTTPSGDSYAQLLRQMFGTMSGAINPSVSEHRPHDENLS